MKTLNIISVKIPIRKLKVLGVLIGVIYFCSSCDFNTETDETITLYDQTGLSITQTFESDPDNFSILTEVLKKTGLNHLFLTYGNYTFFSSGE